MVESSKADDDETVELVDLLSSSMLFSIESSDDHPSLTFAPLEVDVVVVVVVEVVLKSPGVIVSSDLESAEDLV